MRCQSCVELGSICNQYQALVDRLLVQSVKTAAALDSLRDGALDDLRIRRVSDRFPFAMAEWRFEGAEAAPDAVMGRRDAGAGANRSQGFLARGAVRVLVVPAGGKPLPQHAAMLGVGVWVRAIRQFRSQLGKALIVVAGVLFQKGAALFEHGGGNQGVVDGRLLGVSNDDANQGFPQKIDDVHAFDPAASVTEAK